MHVISVLTFSNRATATCSCAGLDSHERFGDKCVALARIDGEAHLAAVKTEAPLEEFRGWAKSSLGYFASLSTLSIEEECPICTVSMSLEPGSLDEVQCTSGHLFTLQTEGGMVGLFPEKEYELKAQAAGIKGPSWEYDYAEDEVLCPFCASSLSELLTEEPFENVVVECDCGHEFNAYKTDTVVTLFSDDNDSPFDTGA